jgi:large subunit ribosomal protein L25
LPDRLPNAIEVDVSPLDIGDSIHVADLKLPEGVEALDVQENFTLVTVVPPAVEEAPAAAEAAAEGAPAAAAGAEGAAPAAGGEAKKPGAEAKGGEGKK